MMPTTILNIDLWVRNLSDDLLAKLMPHLVTWLSNAKTAHYAIALLRSVLAEVPQNRLFKIEGLNSMVNTLSNYLQRYQARTEGLVQKTFLLDMLLQSANSAPQFDENDICKNKSEETKEQKSLDHVINKIFSKI